MRLVLIISRETNISVKLIAHTLMNTKYLHLMFHMKHSHKKRDGKPSLKLFLQT